MAGYSATPLHRKLGIGADARVLLDGAPPGLDLGDLPAGVTVRRRAGAGPYDVIVCFCPDHATLAARWPVLHPLTTPAGSLWIAWPKRTSGVPTDHSGSARLTPRHRPGTVADLDERVVRRHALDHGRVDVKVCAIDRTWSGLKNVIRKADR